MIRILHVVSSLNINAGMMSVLMNCYRNIDRNRIQFDFLALYDCAETHEAEIRSLGGRTFLLKNTALLPFNQKGVRIFFREHRNEYAAVHCHPIWGAELVAREAKKAGVRHIIQHSHSTRFAESRKSEIRNRFLLKFIGLYATDYIACSPEAAFLFGKRRAQSGQVMILPNSIDTRQYSFDGSLRRSFREEFGIAEATEVIGNVGRMAAPKNQLFILDIFSAFLRIRPDSVLFIVGDGELRGEIEKKIEELKLGSSVVLTGKRRDIRAVLSGLDLFLMPSVFEGVPLSALEAMSSGLPCLVSDSVTRSICAEGVTFFPLERTPEEWARQCAAALDSARGKDRTRVSGMIEEKFDIRQTAKRLESFYLELV